MTTKTFSFTALLVAAVLSTQCCIGNEKTWDSRISIANTASTEAGYTLFSETNTTETGGKEGAGLEEIARLLESGMLDKALAAAEKNKSPEVLVYLNNAGVNYTKERRYEEADKIFTGILMIEPRNPDILYNKGLVDAYLGRYADAAGAFGNATELRPEDAEAWYQLASSLYYLKRYNESIYACNKSLNLAPGNAHAWYNMGVALTEVGRYNESVNAYDRALAIKPDYFEAENNRGNVLSELGRYEEALSAYDRALSIKADNQTEKNRDLTEAKLREEENNSHEK